MASKKVIRFSLSEASIDRAIREVELFQADFERKCDELRRRFGERIYWTAENGFQSALVADVVYGPHPANDVTVSISHDDNVTVVIARGKQAVFIEYGAGVFHNGSAEQSPHPWGDNKGFHIGEYGQGKGAHNAWGYWDNNVKAKGNLVITRGTPAAKPMFHGYEQAIQALSDIVQEVFGP